MPDDGNTNTLTRVLYDDRAQGVQGMQEEDRSHSVRLSGGQKVISSRPPGAGLAKGGGDTPLARNLQGSGLASFVDPDIIEAAFEELQWSISDELELLRDVAQEEDNSPNVRMAAAKRLHELALKALLLRGDIASVSMTQKRTNEDGTQTEIAAMQRVVRRVQTGGTTTYDISSGDEQSDESTESAESAESEVYEGEVEGETSEAQEESPQEKPGSPGDDGDGSENVTSGGADLRGVIHRPPIEVGDEPDEDDDDSDGQRLRAGESDIRGAFGRDQESPTGGPQEEAAEGGEEGRRGPEEVWQDDEDRAGQSSPGFGAPFDVGDAQRRAAGVVQSD